MYLTCPSEFILRLCNQLLCHFVFSDPLISPFCFLRPDLLSPVCLLAFSPTLPQFVSWSSLSVCRINWALFLRRKRTRARGKTSSLLVPRSKRTHTHAHTLSGVVLVMNESTIAHSFSLVNMPCEHEQYWNIQSYAIRWQNSCDFYFNIHYQRTLLEM